MYGVTSLYRISTAVTRGDLARRGGHAVAVKDNAVQDRKGKRM